MYRESNELRSEPREAAENAGLTYVSDARKGIERQRVDGNFKYFRSDRSKVSDTRTLSRIKALAIPPAWSDVWMCPVDKGHVQAVGRDARARKQYRYHVQFRELRESAKYDRLLSFGKALPKIRRNIKRRMALRGLPRNKVLATVVHLLDTTLIRVENDEYANQNKSYGLTPLKNRHVAVNGSEMSSSLRAKAANNGI